MELKLNRIAYKDDGIVSELYNGSKLIARTIEHSYDGKPKLPPGTYTCVRGTHALHNDIPFSTFEVTNVPGHKGILFHQGNWQSDSDGCILLGEAVTASNKGTMVTNSKATLADFLEMLKSVDSFQLTVHA